jgi:hypothetical protein
LNTFGKVYRVFTEEVVMWSADDSPFQANSSYALKVLQITRQTSEGLAASRVET